MKRPGLKHRAVLIVEDDLRLRRRILSLLLQEDAEVLEAEGVAAARSALADRDFDFVLLDVHLGDGNGLDLLRERVFPASTSVVVMTADGGLDTAVAAMRDGAADYLVKPFDPFEIPLVYARCRERAEARRRRDHERSRDGSDRFLITDGLRPVERQIERILETDARVERGLPPILIVGETGTGKSTLARRIHDRGPLRDGPFVELNCAALPANLVETELFGHDRGAFTDARDARIGLFEAADGGTLFLDEIAGLPEAAQAKMLTALERGVIRRVGGTREIEVEVRILAASLTDLASASAESRFRPDLYHRLHVVEIRIPPLRERPDDIPVLSEQLLRELCRRYRCPGASISSAGMRRLQSYDWPGNVRELAHELERAVILAGEGDLDFPNLFPGTGAAAAGAAGDDWLQPGWRLPAEGFQIEEAEHRFIRLALEQTNGNVSAAARLLGVNRDFLRYRLRKAGSPADPDATG